MDQSVQDGPAASSWILSGNVRSILNLVNMWGSLSKGNHQITNG